MNHCRIDGRVVGIGRVATHWTGRGKVVGPRLHYVLEVSHAHVLTRFHRYWRDTIEIESDPALDDDYPLPPVDAELRAVGYPDLVEMLGAHRDLFCRFILAYQRHEFLGFVANEGAGDAPDYDYFLDSLTSVDVGDDWVRSEGEAVARTW